MSTDYTTSRILSDIQSKLGVLEHHIIHKTAAPADEPRISHLIWRSLAARINALGDNVLSPALDIETVLERHQRSKDYEKLLVVTKATAGPALSTQTGWAAELVVNVTTAFLGDLSLAATISGVLFSPGGARGQVLAPQTGSIKFVVRDPAASRVSGAFVLEGGAIPVRRSGLLASTLAPCKLGVISTWTEEMGDRSEPGVEGVVRQLILSDTGYLLDSYLLDANAASATRPAGLLNGVTPIAAATATSQAEKIAADVANLIAAIQPSSRFAMLMNPKQAASLAFQPGRPSFTVIASSTVPVGQVIAVDLDSLVWIAAGPPTFDLGSQGALHEEDTNPLALSATGSPNTVAAPMRSLWQTDAIAIRMRWHLAWKAMRTNTVAYINAVTW
jgi:hypothetical protein